MIANLEKVNKNEKKKGEDAKRKIGIGSMDCKALYLSLYEWVKKILYKMIVKNEGKSESPELEWTSTVYSTHSHPRRHRGSRIKWSCPQEKIWGRTTTGHHNCESFFHASRKYGEEEKWHQPERQPATDEEKKKIKEMTVVTAVEAVMANHVYSFWQHLEKTKWWRRHWQSPNRRSSQSGNDMVDNAVQWPIGNSSPRNHPGVKDPTRCT